MKDYLHNNTLRTVVEGKLADQRLQDLLDYAEEAEAKGNAAGATNISFRADELIPLLHELVSLRMALRHVNSSCLWRHQGDPSNAYRKLAVPVLTPFLQRALTQNVPFYHLTTFENGPSIETLEQALQDSSLTQRIAENAHNYLKMRTPRMGPRMYTIQALYSAAQGSFLIAKDKLIDALCRDQEPVGAEAHAYPKLLYEAFQAELVSRIKARWKELHGDK